MAVALDHMSIPTKDKVGTAEFFGRVFGVPYEGPRRDFVVINNGYALYVAGAAATPEEGMAKAQETIDSGRATEKLSEFRLASHALAPV